MAEGNFSKFNLLSSQNMASYLDDTKCLNNFSLLLLLCAALFNIIPNFDVTLWLAQTHAHNQIFLLWKFDWFFYGKSFRFSFCEAIFISICKLDYHFFPVVNKHSVGKCCIMCFNFDAKYNNNKKRNVIKIIEYFFISLAKMSPESMKPEWTRKCLMCNSWRLA